MNIGPDETLDDSVHILVIEDDREYFATVYAILSGINWTRYVIRWAPDYLSALDELKSGRHDVCLLNMRFGDFDGPSIIEYADEQGLATPIILLARADEIVRSTFGAVEWLHSDEIDSELLEQTIRFSVYRGRTQKTLAQHRSAMDSAIDGLAILDKSGYVSSANKQIAATYLFEDSTELDGVELSALFAGEYSRKLARSALAEAGRAGRWSGEAIGMRRDGETFPKEFSISSIGQGRYVLAERDVSESHNLKEQLFKSQRVEGIGQLTGGIIHDFNNLLSAVLGYSQLGLLKLPEHHPLRAYFEEIEKAAERATLLTQQVRSFTSGEDCQAQTVGLNQVIADLETMLARVIPENVASSTELAENLRYVSINRGQLEQVILNLTINAADAMPSGGSLILKTQNVTVDEHTTERSPELEMGGYVFLAVSDTGEGIPEQVVDRIFEPFFTTKASDKGTGLGLSICHGIVTRAGGTISVDSEQGRGSTFNILLPKTSPPVSDPISDSGENDARAMPSGAGTILLAEDEPAVRAVSSRALKNQGYEVIEASNGREALDTVRAMSVGAVDLLITDVVMPVLGGRELADEFEKLQPSAKILYVSGYAERSVTDIAEASIDSNTSFMRKPFSPIDLAIRVSALLTGSRYGVSA